MLINTDNTAIFSLLDTHNRLPVSFVEDQCLLFERDGDLYLVIYFAADRRFISFTIEKFELNFRELSQIMTHLITMDIKEEEEKVIEEALGQIHEIIESGGTATKYFDAH